MPGLTGSWFSALCTDVRDMNYSWDQHTARFHASRVPSFLSERNMGASFPGRQSSLCVQYSFRTIRKLLGRSRETGVVGSGSAVYPPRQRLPSRFHLASIRCPQRCVTYTSVSVDCTFGTRHIRRPLLRGTRHIRRPLLRVLVICITCTRATCSCCPFLRTLIHMLIQTACGYRALG